MTELSSKIDAQILILDDDPVSLRALEKLMQSWGYDTITASCTRDLEDFLRRGIHPTLALLDIELGEPRTGLDLCAELLSRRNIPVIFHTSVTDEAIIRRARSQSNFYGYLTKRSDVVALQSLVELAITNVARAFLLEAFREGQRTAGSLVPYPVICTDRDESIQWINERAEKLLGHSGKELERNWKENDFRTCCPG